MSCPLLRLDSSPNFIFIIINVVLTFDLCVSEEVTDFDLLVAIDNWTSG